MLPEAPVFREAREEDLADIVSLLADDALGATREAPGEPLHPAYRAAFARIAANPDDALIVAEVDGTVCACAQLTLLNGLSHTGMSRAQIEAVRVARDRRGTGLGTRLVEHLIDRARAAGCGMVQLTSTASRTRAHAFYERLGFTATHVGMKLDLRTAAAAETASSGADASAPA
jgi:GNAT superfamily N-acetyltransferase